jgi:hypothetical protein
MLNLLVNFDHVEISMNFELGIRHRELVFTLYIAAVMAGRAIHTG